MITTDELRYALLLANGDLALAYKILDFIAKETNACCATRK